MPQSKYLGYHLGKVYKIVSTTDPDHIPYIGSTKQKLLSSRMSGHRADYKRYKGGKKMSHCASFDLFDKYGIDGCEIVLIEDISATSRDMLRARERHFIQTIECCNRVGKRA